MSTAIAKRETAVGAITTQLSHDSSWEGYWKYEKKIGHIKDIFHRKVGTHSYLHQFFGEHARVVRLKDSIKTPQTRRTSLKNTYIDGFLVVGVGDVYQMILPEEGIFVGFVESARPHLFSTSEPKFPVLVPDHWGVISASDIRDRPYALNSRLSGRPSRNRFGAENLRLHEELDPGIGGWENRCNELEMYLSEPEVIRHARQVMFSGIVKELTKHV